MNNSRIQNFAISTKSVNRARPLNLLRSLQFFQHTVFLSSVTRAALWSNRFQEKYFYHVSLGHTNVEPLQNRSYSQKTRDIVRLRHVIGS